MFVKWSATEVPLHSTERHGDHLSYSTAIPRPTVCPVRRLPSAWRLRVTPTCTTGPRGPRCNFPRCEIEHDLVSVEHVLRWRREFRRNESSAIVRFQRDQLVRADHDREFPDQGC